MANVALTVYCVAMLFTRKVSGLFFKSTNGKKWAWACWGVFFVYSVFTVVGSWDHELSDEYRGDRAKAAEQGHADAQYDLGCCYYNGEGVPRDMAKAVEWFRKAAEQGYADAQYNLGVCYYNGEGIGKDLKEAVLWLEKAKAQGNQEAIDLLFKIESK